ncbi:MAG: flagellar biosynthesis protein FlhB [Clostridium sp.]|jgi:flagellar biosynthetic protein FlhB|nr:flagellar biosynthesis protein FlhB [Clostridium sp.]
MSLAYNLQFFAKEGPGGEKTEAPTSKRLNEARNKGQVVRSKEIANCSGLLAFFVMLKFLAGLIAEWFMGLFPAFYSNLSTVTVYWNGYMPERDIEYLFRQAILSVIRIGGVFFGVAFVVALVSEIAQVGWKITTKPLQPQLSRFNPISGAKRLLSASSIMELVKSIAKLALIAWICYDYLQDKWSILFILFDIPLMEAIALIGTTVIDLGIRISLVYAIIAFADYIYQKVKFNRDMKMTKQEIKDEYKQSEGDPLIKGKIRSKMREVSRRRMMQDLPQADVVITNPTHLAVAIRYDRESGQAPVVIAKGEDYLAARIKEVAKELHIEIVENKPLARMLYANVDIGAAIPEELYQAVAEVLAYVYKIQGKLAGLACKMPWFCSKIET